MDNWEELKAKYTLDEDDAPVIPSEAAEDAAEPVIPSEAAEPVILSERSEPKDLTPPEDILSEAKKPASDPSQSPEYREAARDPSPDGPGTADSADASSKPRKPLFWKIYLISVAVFAVIICALLLFFRSYLKEYEETRPLSAAKKVVAQLAEGKDKDAFYAEGLGKFDAALAPSRLFADAGGTADAEVVEKVGVSTEKKPVYSVREDGREICAVRLKKGRERRFFNEWKVAGVDFPSGEYAVDVTLTADTRLEINGVEVGGEYVVSDEAALPGYTDFGDETPNAVRYVVEGLRYEPKLTLINDYCYPQAEFKNGVWVVTYPGAESNREDAAAIAYNAARAYVTYASSKDAPLDPLDKWLIPGSTLRARVLSFDRRYFTRHDSANFENMEILDFSVYGADQFSVKLSFDYVMTSDGKKLTEKTVMTLYMLRYNGEWKISDVASE